jgi:hypothetical protein
MDQKVIGTVVSVAKQWWLKINTKAIRMGTMDGAIFPHIITVEYIVEGVSYRKRRWIPARDPVPAVGSKAEVLYSKENPKKAMIL